MKIIATLFAVCLTAIAYCQKANPKYDSVLAKKYNADNYGMKKYVLVILKTGSRTTDDKKLRDSLFAGHMANINRMVEINKLVVAGPLSKNEKTYRGIFILDVRTIEEAKVLVQTDPAIKSELLAVELYEWYGSAALPAYLEASEKVGKNKF